MAASVGVTSSDGLRRQRDAEPFGDPSEIGLAPAVTKQERNRDGLPNGAVLRWRHLMNIPPKMANLILNR